EKGKSAGNVFETRYAVENVPLAGRTLDAIKKDLGERIDRKDLDAYIIIPPDILTAGKAEYYARNLGDMITIREINDRLSDAVIEQRMSQENLDRERINGLLRRVELNTLSERGVEKNSATSFILAFIVGFFIYMTTIMYGQTILSAVIEEKSTRVTEMLFSSVNSFPLMLGKLIGVALVALTQYAIWAAAFAVLSLYGLAAIGGAGGFTLPTIAPIAFVYFFLFVLLGFFLYSTLYVLVGSMVTTVQEGGQLALPIVFLLIIAFWLSFPVIRSPDSGFAFWVSIVPFFSPIVMVVRIFSQTPPFWQIALALTLGFATVLGLIWLAGRIYRIGMLMYGKRASIPEVWRWVRQP
ncbi:MAG TPA: ABC transporter permease, partial [Pyrinomonadaceae bacterium]|nr:ABC transporter permease [Pyrinomonadaceae bacterium]